MMRRGPLEKLGDQARLVSNARPSRGEQQLLSALRPKTRGECRAGPRPCPWLSCKYHLGREGPSAAGSVRFNRLDAGDDSCTLDVAERTDGNSETAHMPWSDIGRRLGVTASRAEQIGQAGIAKVRERLREDIDGEENEDGDDDSDA